MRKLNEIAVVRIDYETKRKLKKSNLTTSGTIRKALSQYFDRLKK